MGRMYDTGSNSKYSPLSNSKLVEEARNKESGVNQGSAVGIDLPNGVGAVVHLGSKSAVVEDRDEEDTVIDPDLE